MVVGLLQRVDQRVAVEQVNAHARQAIAAVAFDAAGVDPRRVHRDVVQLASVCGFSRKPTTRPLAIDAHDAQRSRPRSDATGLAGDRDVGLGRLVRRQHLAVSPSGKAGRRRGSARTRCRAAASNAGSCAPRRPCPDTSRARRPSSSIVCWAARISTKPPLKLIEPVRAADVPVQAHRLELRQHVDLVDPAVDAVRDRNVDQPILAAPAARPASSDTS